MSWQATSWAMCEASTHGDAQAKLVLICLANFARPDGTGAYPTVRSIVAMTEIPERSVRRKLALLKDMGLIRPGDQRLVAGYSADKRPIVYDLVMKGARESGMSEQQEQARVTEANLEHSETVADMETGCHTDTPRGAKPAGRNTNGMPYRHPAGCHTDTSRGATVAPKPLNKNLNNNHPPIAPQGAKRKTIPDDWQPDPKTRALADGLGVDFDAELERFRLHAEATGRRLADWGKGFELWLNNSATRTPRREPPRKPHTHTWACEHTKRILAKFGILDPSDQLDLAIRVGERLKAGDSEEEITDLLVEQREHEWEGAA